MAIDPIPLDTTFTAPIGLQVKGETWSCVEVPGSAELFGTRKGVRADVVIDGIPLPNVGLPVTGTGGLRDGIDKLKQLKAELSPTYVLIDCPPSLNLLTLNAMAAADAVGCSPW